MDDEAAVRRAAAELVAAFGEHRVDDYFDRFADSATFVFHHVPRVLGSREEYRELWHQWERDDDFRVRDCHSSDAVVRLFGDVAVFTHDVATTVSTSDGEETLRERETIVFTRGRDDRWLAVHEHLSPHPGGEGVDERAGA